MTERPPQSSSEKMSAPSQEAVPSLPTRTIDALAVLLAMRPETDRRKIDDAYGDFIRAVQGDARQLETGELREFERGANSLLNLIGEAAGFQLLSEEVRTYLRMIPDIVRNFMAGQGRMEQLEGLVAGSAKSWWGIRQTVGTIETLSKKANSYRIEKELAQTEKEKAEVVKKVEELEGERPTEVENELDFIDVQEELESSRLEQNRDVYEKLKNVIESLPQDGGLIETWTPETDEEWEQFTSKILGVIKRAFTEPAEERQQTEVDGLTRAELYQDLHWIFIDHYLGNSYELNLRSEREGISPVERNKWRSLAKIVWALRTDEDVPESLKKVVYAIDELNRLNSSREELVPEVREYERKVVLYLRRLDELEAKRGSLEEEKILQEEVVLLETGLSIYGDTFTPEERSALSSRLQAIKTGTAETLPLSVKDLELKLAGLMQGGHEILLKNAREFESELLKQEWMGLGYRARADFKARLIKFLSTLTFLFADDIWPSDRIGARDLEERSSLGSLTDSGRARLLLEKIRVANLPREERERGRYNPNFFGIFRRSWLRLPFNPRNTVFLAKCREIAVEELVQLQTREQIVSEKTKERTSRYQEVIKDLGPHLENFLVALNSVRKEKGKNPLTLNKLAEAEGTEVYSALERMMQAGFSPEQIFTILERARNSIRDLPARKKAEEEIAKAYPLFRVDAQDKIRWQEAILRDILREADEIGFEVRSAKRETWARWTIAGILKNPEIALEEFRRQLPPEGDPGRKVWLELLSANTAEEAESIITSLTGNVSLQRQIIRDLETRARMIPHERRELEQHLAKLMLRAREYQKKITASGGRGILEEREKRDRVRAGEREMVRAERGEEILPEESRRGRREREGDRFLFAEPPSEERQKELEKKAGLRWGEAPRAERENPELLREYERGLIVTAEGMILGLTRERQASISSEDNEKLDFIWQELKTLKDRIKEKPLPRSVVEKSVKSLLRRAEVAFGMVPRQELDRRLGIISAREKALKASKFYGEAVTEAAPAPETKPNKKGGHGMSKKDKKKAALDERHKGQERTGKEKTAQAARKEKQATRKKKK